MAARAQESAIDAIVKTATGKTVEMGGGEQFIGRLSQLVRDAGIKNKTDFLVELGEALERAGMQLTSAPGEPDELYASPLEK